TLSYRSRRRFALPLSSLLPPPPPRSTPFPYTTLFRSVFISIPFNGFSIIISLITIPLKFAFFIWICYLYRQINEFIRSNTFFFSYPSYFCNITIFFFSYFIVKCFLRCNSVYFYTLGISYFYFFLFCFLFLLDFLHLIFHNNLVLLYQGSLSHGHLHFLKILKQ